MRREIRRTQDPRALPRFFPVGVSVGNIIASHRD
jgi:hypothetical protein